MSQTDSFIDEVTEEVRRDRLFKMLRRYGWIGIACILALVGGASWNEWRKAQTRASAEAFGTAVLSALELPEAAARQGALSAIAAEGDARALLGLLAGSEAADGADPVALAAAMDGLAAVAEDTRVSALWRELAAFRRLATPGAGLSDMERRAGLEALAQPGRPFRPLALEQLALLRLEAGDQAAALAEFRTLAALAEAPSGLRERAGQMIVILGGGMDD